jgi:hypothetical protein
LEAKNISSSGKSQESNSIVPLSELKKISKKNEKFTSITANRYRGDLLNAGIGDGHYSIYYQLPNSIHDGHRHTITCKVEGTKYMLSKDPFIIDPVNTGINHHSA